MRLEAVRLALDPGSQDEGGDQGRNTRADMDDCAAGEVEDAQVVEPAAVAPDPVGDRRIHDESPQQREQHEGLEALAFGEGTGNEGRRYDSEHHLEGHEGGSRNVGRVLRQRLLADAPQADVVEAADDAPAVDVLAEGEREAQENPRHAHQGEDEDAVHDRAEHVLAADQTAVEQSQTRRHEHDERGRGQDPGRVARVDGARGGVHAVVSFIPRRNKRPVSVRPAEAYVASAPESVPARVDPAVALRWRDGCRSGRRRGRGASGAWRVAAGEWRVAAGGWRVARGGGRVARGGRRRGAWRGPYEAGRSTGAMRCGRSTHSTRQPRASVSRVLPW